jgi:hypothetical protein
VKATQVREITQNGDRFFALNYSDPCLITYTRGRLSESNLSYSNLFAHWQYLVNGRAVRKSPEFKKWAEAVFRWVRKMTLPGPEEPAHRRTPRVADAVAAGTVTLI